MLLLKKLFIPQKNIKLFYYLRCMVIELYPKVWCRSRLEKYLKHIDPSDRPYLQQRLNYYNKLLPGSLLPADAMRLSEYKIPRRHSVYYFDFVEHARYFSAHLQAEVLGGDITHVPPSPTFVKSRPVQGDNKNGVVLKFNKVRHFNFIKYDKPFATKKDTLVWRGAVLISHRARFMEMYLGHPLCNIGQTNQHGGNAAWIKKRMSMNEQLEYKFILCIEGNDVATNLKWVMSSNSVAVMPKPTYETWFMEGTLVPGYHYIEINDQYTDLEEKLRYYIAHPEEARQIAKNANEYIRQFRNKKREDLLSLLVLEKYFVQTGQMKQISDLDYQE